MLLLTLTPCLAQTLPPSAAPTTAAGTKTDGTVILNIFEVKSGEDDPYRASNTSAGTRYDAPLRELPMQVDVFTREFLNDIGATDLRDVLGYVGGVQSTSGTGNNSEDAPDNISFSIRGLGGGLPKKDGFTRSFATDSISVGRVDVIKGPGGALYEHGNLGGVLSYSSPQPQARRTSAFRQYIGDHSYYRTEIQTNGGLNKTNSITMFVGAAYQRGDSIMGLGYAPMYSFHEKLAVSPSVNIQLTAHTKITGSFDYQYITRDNLGGSGRASAGLITDNATYADATGITRNYGYVVEGRSATNNNNRALVTPDQKNFRFDGPGTYSKQHQYGQILRVDHAFSRDFQIWAGYNLESRHIKDRGYTIALRNWNDTTNVPTAIRTDPRFLALLRGPAVVPNAQGVITPDASHQVLEIRPNNVSNDSINFRPMWKSEIYYKFDVASTSHRLITGATWQSYKSDTGSPRYAYDYTAAIWNSLSPDLILSRYRSPTDFTTVKRWDTALFAKYPVPTTSSAGYIPYTVSHFIDRILYTNLDSTYFHGRFRSVIGLLDDRSDRQGRIYDPASNFLWAGPAPTGNNPDGTPRNPFNAPSGVMRRAPITKRPLSISLSYIVTEGFTIYGNRSAATDPGSAYSAYDGEGRPMTPPKAENREVGIHWEFWKKKILLNASYFKNTVTDNNNNIGIAYQNFPYNPANGTPYSTAFNARTQFDSQSAGYDVKLDYRISDSFRLNARFANHRGEITKIGDIGQPGSPDPVFRAQQDKFAATNPNANAYIGKDPNDASRHEASGFARWDPRQGFAKGSWVMVGVKYAGVRTSEIVTIPSPTTANPNPIPTFTFTRVPKKLTYDLNFGYKRRVGRYLTDSGVNIVNLTDNQDWYSSYWNAPRTVRFFTGVNF